MQFFVYRFTGNRLQILVQPAYGIYFILFWFKTSVSLIRSVYKPMHKYCNVTFQLGVRTSQAANERFDKFLADQIQNIVSFFIQPQSQQAQYQSRNLISNITFQSIVCSKPLVYILSIFTRNDRPHDILFKLAKLPLILVSQVLVPLIM